MMAGLIRRVARAALGEIRDALDEYLAQRAQPSSPPDNPPLILTRQEPEPSQEDAKGERTPDFDEPFLDWAMHYQPPNGWITWREAQTCWELSGVERSFVDVLDGVAARGIHMHCPGQFAELPNRFAQSEVIDTRNPGWIRPRNVSAPRLQYSNLILIDELALRRRLAELDEPVPDVGQ